jgi:sugar lactone lactonase YvrE
MDEINMAASDDTDRAEPRSQSVDIRRRRMLQAAAAMALPGPGLGAQALATDVPLHADVAIQQHNLIGESPVWDARCGRLLWLDQASGTVFEAYPNRSGSLRETNRWELQRPVAAIILRRAGGFAVAAGAEILLLEESTGSTSSLVTLDIDPLTRINEVKCDPQGRMWVATLVTDFTTAVAGLYRIDPDRQVTPILSGVRVGNGMDWSPDGNTFFFTDSLTQSVDAFDFDATTGMISGRRSVVRFEQCAPDGLTVDRHGCLWIAAAAAGEVRRYTPEGELLSRVKIATPGVTSCSFGGRNHQFLFATSISIRMPEIPELEIPSEQLENNHPDSGAVFVCRPHARGLPTNYFAG